MRTSSTFFNHLYLSLNLLGKQQAVHQPCPLFFFFWVRSDGPVADSHLGRCQGRLLMIFFFRKCGL